jgi:predicted RNase H-like nuclease
VTGSAHRFPHVGAARYRPEVPAADPHGPDPDPDSLEPDHRTVLGIDACRGGWVAVRLTGSGFTGYQVAATLVELLDAGPVAELTGLPPVAELTGLPPVAELTGLPPVAVAGIDMPLGLLDRGWRQADLSAASLVGPRRASVFRIPPRAVFHQDGYAAANRCCRELTGAGLSRQSWALRAKVLEADAFAAGGSQAGTARRGLFEVHPELSFATMAGATLAVPKSTVEGELVRRRLLAAAGIDLPDLAGHRLRRDLLDAAAVAWTAQRIAAGRANRVPDPPQRGPDGVPIAIWF